MYCAKCGKEIRDGSKFCGFCGASVAASVKKTEGMSETALTEKSENPVAETPRADGNAPEKKEKKTGLVFVYGTVGLIAGVLAGVFLIKNVKKEPEPVTNLAVIQETQRISSEEEEFTEEAEEEEVIEETEAEETFTEETDEDETEEEAENSQEYILPECTTRLYTEEELKNLSLEELRLARNEIYARHGRSFQAEDLKQYFSEKSWYEPLYSSAEMDALGDSILNTFEVENRNLIVQIEAELKGE